jgi:FtsH-binding integral membrane protein
MDAHSHAPQAHCLNCQAPLQGPFCAQCGQEAHHSARSLRTLLHEAFESLTHLDGRLWRTLRALLFRPGFLTAEYLADRRARYFPPFRLYLVISLVFFALGMGGGPPSESPPAKADNAEEVRKAEKLAEVCAELPKLGDEAANKRVQATCLDKLKQKGRGALGVVFLQTLPKTMFLFLPVVALALYLLFFRVRRYYVEHLVFALHYQSGMFVLFGLAVFFEHLDNWWSALDDVGDLLFVGMFGLMAWYTWRALRTVYGQGWFRTFVKLGCFAFAYSVLLGFTMLGTLIYGVLKG